MKKKLVTLGMTTFMMIWGIIPAFANTIVSVTDIKELPYEYYCADAIDGIYGFRKDGKIGMGYVDSNFNVILEPFDMLNGTSIYKMGSFNGGLAPIGKYTNDGLSINDYDLINTSGHTVAKLGILSDLRGIPKGQDANNVLYFGVGFYREGIKTVSYLATGEMIRKQYTVVDYPELEGANRLEALVDGKMKITKSSISNIKNEGSINQEVYRKYKGLGTLDTLGNYSSQNIETPQKGQYRNDSYGSSMSYNYESKFPASGAFFEEQGDRIVLKDSAGYVKFELIKSRYQVDSYQIVNDTTFLGRPYGSNSDSPWHLYKITYNE